MKSVDFNLRELEGCGVDLREREPLAPYTSFKIGGEADLMARVGSDEQLACALRFAREVGGKPIIIGRGTNLLVKDNGIRGIVIILGGDYRKKGLLEKGEGYGVVEAGAGATLASIGAFALTGGLSGMEGLAGIPGNLGGALVINAGAGGQEIASLVESVRVMDLEGRVVKIFKKDMAFGYRTSSLAGAGVLLSVRLRLPVGDREEILRAMKARIRRRRETQPFGYPSAGSVFKNPPGDSAGRLIDSVGLKGTRVGGAMISDKHANFILNMGGAKASDVLELMRVARDRVLGDTGVSLAPEIRVEGE